MRTFKEIALFAHLSSMAYLTTSNEVEVKATALGCSYIALVGEPDCQADLVSVMLGGVLHYIIAVRGTQFSENFSMREVLEDLDRDIVNLSFGGYHKGAAEGLVALYFEIQHFIPLGAHVIVIGHSLGGARACLLPAYLNHENYMIEVYSFAPFKSATKGFWEYTYPGENLYPWIFINNNDFAPTWPWFESDLCHASKQIIHLTGSNDNPTIEQIEEYPSPRLSEFDHSIDNYCAKLDALAASEKE